jgi:hypothetical protein
MEYPLVNGHRMSFASINLSVDGTETIAFRSVTYNDTAEPGEVRGSHAQILGRTIGDYTCEASLEIYAEELDQFLRAFGDGYMEKVFDVIVTYSEEAGGPTVTDKVNFCRIRGVTRNHAQGTDPLSITIDLHPLFITRSGVNPLRRMLQASAF